MFFDSFPADLLTRSFTLAAIALGWIIATVRIIGLRSFSKMTAFDFVVTVAIGSLLAGAAQATAWKAFFQSSLAMSALLIVQYVIARLRQTSSAINKAISNTPVLLMRDGEILHDALQATRVTQSDLLAKLREANVLDFSQVRAVILENTGDISVLHGAKLQTQLLDGVKSE